MTWWQSGEYDINPSSWVFGPMSLLLMSFLLSPYSAPPDPLGGPRWEIPPHNSEPNRGYHKLTSLATLKKSLSCVIIDL